MRRRAQDAVVVLLVLLVTGPVVLAQDVQDVTVHGAWRSDKEVDVIDDTVDTRAFTEAGENNTLALVCVSNRRLALVAVFGFQYVGGERRRTIFRVDRNDVYEQLLPVTFSGSWSRVAWPLPDPKLIEDMKSGSTLYVRTFDSSDMAVTVEFPLNGFTAASEPVFEACRPRVALDLGDEVAGTATTAPGEDVVLLEMPFLSDQDVIEVRKGPEPVGLQRKSGTFYLVGFPDGTQAWIHENQLTDLQLVQE